MKTPFPARPLSTGIRRALLCSVFLAPIGMIDIAAADSSPQREYHIAQGDLGQALTRFAAEAGVVLSFDPELTRGHGTSGLQGQYGVIDGLAKLLQGSGLQAEPVGDGRYALVTQATQSSALELGSTSIVSNQLGTITENSGSYTPGTIATATRLVLTPRETPQSITVVTRQAMDDFGMENIDDVMRHTPGITVSAYDTDRNNYYARGFGIQNFQYDGIPTTRSAPYSAGHTLSDMAIYDRVEILKGATGLLTGAGAPGGTINLVRKKPTSEFKGHVELGAGSWDNYRSELDVSGPLTESGNVRGRAVAAYQDKHSYLDHYERKTTVYYGVLEFDLAPDTLLSVGADYQDNDPRGSSWSGAVPIYDSQGNRISTSRSFNNGAEWSRWEQYTRTVFATLEHNFANDWVSKVQLHHQINGYYAPLGSAQGRPNATSGLTSIYGNKYTGETITDSADVYFSGPFSLFGREHQLVVGAAASKAHWKGKDYWSPTYLNGNAYDFWSWDGGDGIEPDWGTVNYRTDQTTWQTGGYLTSRFSLADDLTLILGTRLANYKITGTSDTRETGRLVPYIGAIYDLTDELSLYASYTDIFLPQTDYRDSSNTMLEPDEGQNYELGIKGEFFDGHVNASLAYFEVREENRPEEDSTYNAAPTNPAISYAYRGIKATTKGVEAELSGELTPGWNLMGGYTHKIVRDEHGDKVSTWEPQDQFNIYTTYKLQGPLERLTVGGGARWQGQAWQVLSNRAKGTQEKFTQDDFWLVDLMARYKITDNLSASVNLNNLFDKKYYTNVGFYNSVSYGDPRNVMLSTRWDF
ncbi:TonB-dependent siderophore receptor [Pseudomonas sp. LRF_L74]|uniref:TonB-dependent siderophore receptor n=1 Tax=Pseudomonas sp. LRF_L74 TaxID=3369422 RepID=UPI003F61E2D8